MSHFSEDVLPRDQCLSDEVIASMVMAQLCLHHDTSSSMVKGSNCSFGGLHSQGPLSCMFKG